MSKVISQETFDDVVRENMTEFDMSADEAIKEATDQFQAQGVNLANIIPDLVLHTSEDGSHPLVDAITALNDELPNCQLAAQTSNGKAEEKVPNMQRIRASLTQLRSQCLLDLAHRCMAGKHQAMPVLFALFECLTGDAGKAVMADASNGDTPPLLETVLETMGALLIGQPDIVTEEQLKKMVFFVEKKPLQLSYKELLGLLIVLRQTCLMHESNRQCVVEAGIIPPLVGLLGETEAPVALKSLLIREACLLLRTLTLDDDMRVPFGRAHEHAKMIVADTPALSLLLNLCKTYHEEDDHMVMAEIFHTLSKLSVRDEFCQHILDKGGVAFIIQALENYLEFQSIAVTSLGVIKTLAGNDNVKVMVGESGGIPVMLRAMDRHNASETVMFNGCSALAAVCLRQPENANRVAQAGGIAVVTQAISVHKKNADTIRQACLLVRNMVARSPELKPTLLQAGLESLLNEYGLAKCPDEAKAALRDLDCDVKFVELWTGLKGCIPD